MGPTGTGATWRSHSSDKKGGYRTAGKSGKVKPPPFKGPLFLYNNDINEEALAKVAAAETKDEVRRLLAEYMKIDQAEGLTTEILKDLHYHDYAFCVSKNFSYAKISTFLSIMKMVLQECVERKLPVEEGFHVFKTWLLKHSVERWLPPQSVGIFTYEETQALLEYVHGSFFRHYKLYMYVYMTRCDIRVRLKPESMKGLGQPPKMLPLYAQCAVEPSQQPEFAYIFEPSEEELAQQALRGLQGDKKEDRAALIKRKVDEGVKKLMESFEAQIKEQDDRFRGMMS